MAEDPASTRILVATSDDAAKDGEARLVVRTPDTLEIAAIDVDVDDCDATLFVPPEELEGPAEEGHIDEMAEA